MSIKIRINREINESHKKNKWNGWNKVFEDDNTQQNASTNTNQTAQTPTNTSTNTNQTTQAPANNPTANVQQFVTEVSNFYTGLCTQLKELCKPDNIKKTLTSYDKLKEDNMFKGSEKDFANAVNSFQQVDPKNYQQGLQSFSKIIEELGKYVTGLSDKISTAQTAQPVQPVQQQPAPAQTQGPTVNTTTNTAPQAPVQQPAAQPVQAVQQPVQQPVQPVQQPVAQPVQQPAAQ